MTDQIQVQAVPGRLCPHPLGKGFIGWAQCEPGEEAEHVVPGGFGFVRTGAVTVQDTRFIRMAIKRGDIIAVIPAKKGQKVGE